MLIFLFDYLHLCTLPPHVQPRITRSENIPYCSEAFETVAANLGPLRLNPLQRFSEGPGRLARIIHGGVSRDLVRPDSRDFEKHINIKYQTVHRVRIVPAFSIITLLEGV